MSSRNAVSERVPAERRREQVLGSALSGLLIALGLLASTAPVCAQGWVGPLSELAPAPIDLHDARRPLGDRVAFVRDLGRYGPPAESVEVLLDALRGELPSELLEAVYYALALRAPVEAEGPLLERLRSEPAASTGLCLALAALSTPRALAGLVGALPRSAGHAAAAQRALVHAGARGSQALAAGLRGSSAVLAARTLELLGEEGRSARAALETALASPDSALALASARALAALGDEAAADALASKLSSADAELAGVVLGALGELATPAQARVLEGYASRAHAELSPAWLQAYARASPRAALPRLRAAALQRHPSALRAAAWRVLEGTNPDPAWLLLLERLLARHLRDATASALARLDGGQGVAGLLRVARLGRTAAARVSRALAIAVRRFGNELDRAQVREVHALLQSLGPGPRSLRLRGIARDPSVSAAASAALSAKQPEQRAAAAAALGWLDARAAAPSLFAALARERDPEAARRMAEALVTIGAEAPAELPVRLREDPSTLPETLLLAAQPAGSGRALARELRGLLSESQPARVRVAAALALGRLADRSARTALLAALGDPSARLRLAVVHALGTLGAEDDLGALARHIRIEPDPRVRSAARALLAGRPKAPAHGSQVLEVRLVGDVPRANELVDILLTDGRWMRTVTGEDGELLVPDLAGGDAEVRLVD